MAQEVQSELVRERILNEAEALFAQKGYRGVTVREIIEAADCNLSAVNYYFGNKKNLYLELFRTRWIPRSKYMHKCFIEFLSDQGSLTLVTLVKAIARSFLEAPLSTDELQRHYQLMAREMSQPSEAFDLAFEQAMQPHFQELAHRFRSVIPEEMEEERLILRIQSIIGMVIHFHFARPAITRFTGHEYDSSFKKRLVDHIIDFSLNGLGLHAEAKPW